MKNLLSFALIVLFTATAFGQNISEKSLQGTWKITGIDTPQVKFDLKLQKYTIAPDQEAKLTAEQKENIVKKLNERLELFKDGTISFEGNKLNHVMGPMAQRGTFTLAQKDAKQYIILTEADGTVIEMPVSLSGKKLTFSLTDGGGTMTFYYTK